MIKNKNILITGGNSGIGFFAIINLLKKKNNLYVVIKNEFRKNEFLQIIEKYFDKNYLSKYLNIIENCDLSDLENALWLCSHRPVLLKRHAQKN